MMTGKPVRRSDHPVSRRTGNPRAWVVVVNPNSTEPARGACRLLGLDYGSLTATSRGGFDVLAAGRLICVKAGAEDVDAAFLQAVLDSAGRSAPGAA